MTANIQLLLIQLPVILGLYFVFLRSGLPTIDMEILYSFVPAPERIQMNFLGLLNLSSQSVLLAALAGISQHIFTRLSFPPPTTAKPTGDFQDEMQRRMRFMFLYPMPIFIAVIAYVFSAAVALYWVTSNIFSIGQEFLVRRRLEKKETYGNTITKN